MTKWTRDANDVRRAFRQLNHRLSPVNAENTAVRKVIQKALSEVTGTDS